MKKNDFINNFVENCNLCVDFAKRYHKKDFPSSVICNLAKGAANRPLVGGKIKMTGGKIVKDSDLESISPIQAANFLFVNNKTPFWIKLTFIGFTSENSIIEVFWSKEVTKDENKLYKFPDGSTLFNNGCKDPLRIYPNNQNTSE